MARASTTPLVAAITSDVVQTKHNELISRVNDIDAEGTASQPAVVGTLTIGSGDAQSLYVTSAAQRLAVKDGTSGAPDTGLGALVKVERTSAVTDSGWVGGDGGEAMAAIMGIHASTTAGTKQTVGVYGAALHVGTTDDGDGHPDSCGIYGAGRITGSGVGTGVGGFFIGRRDTATGQCLGIEVHCANYGGTDEAYTPLGFSDAQGIWLNAGGDADSAVGIVISNAFGRQFEVGLAFTAQVTNSKTGGAKAASIRDDGNATTSIDINGSHTNGIDMAGATLSGKPLVFASAHAQQSVGSAGFASALPASPSGYIKMSVGGEDALVPFYAAT